MRCAFALPKGFSTYYRRSCLDLVLLASVRFSCGAVVLPNFRLGETPGDRCTRARRACSHVAHRRVPSVEVMSETSW
jgi:hypothetical protein